jgi:hypothetical protein
MKKIIIILFSLCFSCCLYCQNQEGQAAIINSFGQPAPATGGSNGQVLTFTAPDSIGFKTPTGGGSDTALNPAPGAISNYQAYLNFITTHINYTTTASTTINLTSANFVANVILGATASNNLTINLPAPNSVPTGVPARVQFINTPLVLINPHSTETIDGKTVTGGVYISFPGYNAFSNQYMIFSHSIVIYSDNTNWHTALIY